MWKGGGRGLIMVLYRNLRRGTKENHENLMQVCRCPDRYEIGPDALGLSEITKWHLGINSQTVKHEIFVVQTKSLLYSV